MESSVSSQKSPTTYSADVFKLYKDDIDFESELFEINIFNSTLHIAPGKSISGDDGLVYFYVYAIKDEKVVANLGVYELITDEQKSIYDISTFESLLLFDYYYTNQAKIKEFEIIGKNNIFDYIYTHLELEKDKLKLVALFNEFLRYIKKEKETLGDNYKLYTSVLSLLSKDIKTIGITKEILDKLKENCISEKKKPVELFKITLAILESFYNVHFLLVDNGETVSNYREKTPPQTFKPKQYIIVSTDHSFVSTSSTFKEPEPDAEADVEAQDDAAEVDVDPEAHDDAAEVDVDPEAEAQDDAEEIVKVQDEKAKAESDEEADFNVDVPKAPPKAPSKAKVTPRPRLPKVSKHVSSSEPENKVKLSAIPESTSVKPEKKVTKLKASASKSAEAMAEPKVKPSRVSETKESKSEQKESKSETKESKSEQKESKPRLLKTKPKP